MEAKALIAQLKEEDAFIEFPEEAERWSLDAIQTFYDTCGEIRPDEESAAAAPAAAVPAAAPQPEPEPEQPAAGGAEPSLEEMRAELKQRLLAAAALAEKHRALAESLEAQQQRTAALAQPAEPMDLMAASSGQQLGGAVEQPPAKTGSFPVGGWKASRPSDMTAAGYRDACIAAGIPFRPNGLFGSADIDLLQSMAARPGKLTRSGNSYRCL